MGTRGAITRLTDGGFVGRYHHWDSYPKGLGATLFHAYHQRFGGNLSEMLRFLIDQHPAGWSTVNHSDWSQPGFDGPGIACYCHGSRTEEANEITHENASACGVEWVYAFNERDHKMAILASYDHETGGKMVGFFGMGDEEGLWAQVVVVDLRGPEPDWESIEQQGCAPLA